MFVTAGTRKEIVGRLNAEVLKALNSQEMRDFITKEGAEPVGSSAEELAAYFTREVDKYAKVIKAAQIPFE
jgi:tripartite-type tricarboxylate transporter receptor subunit TctC